MIIEDSQSHAEENGFKLNPDENIVKFITEALVENEKNLGARLCHCGLFVRK